MLQVDGALDGRSSHGHSIVPFNTSDSDSGGEALEKGLVEIPIGSQHSMAKHFTPILLPM